MKLESGDKKQHVGASDPTASLSPCARARVRAAPCWTRPHPDFAHSSSQLDVSFSATQSKDIVSALWGLTVRLGTKLDPEKIF